jgi:hypothetical protein
VAGKVNCLLAAHLLERGGDGRLGSSCRTGASSTKSRDKSPSLHGRGSNLPCGLAEDSGSRSGSHCDVLRGYRRGGSWRGTDYIRLRAEYGVFWIFELGPHHRAFQRTDHRRQGMTPAFSPMRDDVSGRKACLRRTYLAWVSRQLYAYSPFLAEVRIHLVRLT